MSDTKRAVERVDLGDDRWADVWARPTGGEIARFHRIVQQKSGTDDSIEIVIQGVLIFTNEWNLTDEATGDRLPLKREGYEAADSLQVATLFKAIWAIVETRLPKL